MLLTGQIDSAAQFITVFILFIVVLVITAFTTRWIAGYQKQQNIIGNIEVIDTQRIANGKYIQIIRVGDKYIAVAVCKDTVTMLTEVDKEQIRLNETGSVSAAGFGELFDKVKKIYSGNNQEPKEK